MVEVYANPAYTAWEFNQECTTNGGLLYNGWTIISLCVYRFENVPHYAAVWIHARMPQWVPFYDKDADGYQDFYNTWHKKGFNPIIVSASGGGVRGENETLKEIFAGVFTQGRVIYAKHNMNGKTFTDKCVWAKKNSYVLRWATIYGGNDTLYAGIWEKVSNTVKWDYRFFKSYEGPELGVPVRMPGNPSLQLSFVTRSPVGEHLGVYRSDQNLDIIERHEMPLRGYSIEEKKMEEKKPKYLPWIIQVGADPRIGTDAWNMPNIVAVFRKDLPRW
jgi:hypothetical protein